MTESWPHRVAILFSGGDLPGMIALLSNLARLGLNRPRAVVLGVKDGYAGLVRSAREVRSGQSTVARGREEIDTHPGLAGIACADQYLVLLDRALVSGLLGQGGIMLGASR